MTDELPVVTVTYSPGPHLERFLSSLTVATDPERRTCFESGCREPATHCGSGWNVYCDKHDDDPVA